MIPWSLWIRLNIPGVCQKKKNLQKNPPPWYSHVNNLWDVFPEALETRCTRHDPVRLNDNGPCEDTVVESFQFKVTRNSFNLFSADSLLLSSSCVDTLMFSVHPRLTVVEWAAPL